MVTDRLDNLARALKALPDLLTYATEQVVQDNAFLLELENQQQLAAGLDSQDRPITPDYAPLTRLLKQEAGLDPNKVTLRHTGAYYASIVAQVRGEELDLVATDPKADELAAKYGEDILGLSPEAKDTFQEEVVRPDLEQQARRALGI
jgi:hypothetical protein